METDEFKSVNLLMNGGSCNKLVFRIDDNDVYIVGMFHNLEDYFS